MAVEVSEQREIAILHVELDDTIYAAHFLLCPSSDGRVSLCLCVIEGDDPPSKYLPSLRVPKG
jgi:hypothetical protein